MESNWSQRAGCQSFQAWSDNDIMFYQTLVCHMNRKSHTCQYFSTLMIMQYISEGLKAQYHTHCPSWSVNWEPLFCVCPCLLPRPESGESISFYQALPRGATISARPERLDLHWSVRGLSAPADGPGHSTRLSAQHSHRGQACHQPEKLRYLHCEGKLRSKVLQVNGASERYSVK